MPITGPDPGCLQAEVRLARLAEDIAALEQKLARLDEAEQSQHWQLLNQLEDDTLAPLRALDPALVSASPGQALDEDTRARIQAFAGLFQAQDGGFDWFDVHYPARAPQRRRRGLLPRRGAPHVPLGAA